MKAPVIHVGIFTRKSVSFVFNDNYQSATHHSLLTGEQTAEWKEGEILFQGKSYQEILFEPQSPDGTFSLKAVTIGVNFHWQQQEDQRFQGALKLLACKEGIIAINQIDLEKYLTCVIASEMNAHAPKEFLKAHAVISRSWLLAQIEKKNRQTEPQVSCFQNDERLIRWYDREDHLLFDVCADDHCQRYQGMTRSADNPTIQEVINETKGQILTYNGSICDARFSKCCGGVTEEFEHCWEPVHHPYLSAVADHTDSQTFPDLTEEAEAEKWIRSSSPAFCNTRDTQLLALVLNKYDQTTTDFYRWKVIYSQDELSELIARKSGISFGKILQLNPLKRGKSGRIEELQIIGTEKELIVGKELEIRRFLSETHLYSSAFVVNYSFGENKEIPESFTFTGAGWGHGVGLCQIGAAVMSTQGYNYQEILSHYYPGSALEKRY